MGRTLKRTHETKYDKLLKEIKRAKLERDIADLLNDVVNIVSEKQTPSTGHPHIKRNYKLHPIKGIARSPSACSAHRCPVETQTYFKDIFEENVIDYENEFEAIVPDQKREISDNKLIANQEQVILNTLTIKQEIDSDAHHCSVGTETFFKEIFEENVIDYENEFEAIVPDQKCNFEKEICSKTYHRSVRTQTYFKEIFKAPKFIRDAATIGGRRIIDFQHFFNELKDASSHSKSLCSLNNMIITKEEKNGISTSYCLKCLVCNFRKEINSESPYRDTDLNTDFVSGILSIECNFLDAYLVLAQMHLPLLNNDEFIQECKYVCLTMDKKTQQTLLKTHQDASRNLNKELQKRSLSKKLAALKQTFCEQENVQKEHQLTTTQQCSSVSDDNNIERESQLTTMKLSSSAHGNIQTEHKLVTTQQCSSKSDNSSLFEQMHLGGLLVEGEFEVKEENVTDYENEFEANMPDHSTNSSAGSLSDCSTHRSVGTQTYPPTFEPPKLRTREAIINGPTRRSVGTQTYPPTFEPPKLRTREAIINGRRIVDFQYFFNELKDASSHSKSLCNLNNMIITEEEKNGIITSYSLTCLVCNFEKKICSESPYRDTNLNAHFVSGILSIDCNFMDAYILLAQMHLPLLNNNEFIQECKNVCLTMDTKTQHMLLENHRIALGNLRKELEERTIDRELAAKKKSFCEQENVQKEHQLTTTEQCLSVSDNSNIQRVSQSTTMEQSSSAHENIQTEHKLVTTQQYSSKSDNSNLFEQMHLGGLLIKDEFEVKEENVIDYENEFETFVPYQKIETSDSKLMANREQVILNMLTIKQEIDSDDENFSKSITKEITNKEHVIMNDKQIGATLTQTNEERAYENTMVINRKKICFKNL